MKETKGGKENVYKTIELKKKSMHFLNLKYDSHIMYLEIMSKKEY